MNHKIITVSIFKSRSIEARSQYVWEQIRDFDSPRYWNPGVENVHLRLTEKNMVGQVRELNIHDGKVFVERLEQYSEAEMSMVYSMVSCPMPVIDYVASNCVIPITSSDSSLVVWRSTFKCMQCEQAAMEHYFGVDAYEEGLLGIERLVLSKKHK